MTVSQTLDQGSAKTIAAMREALSDDLDEIRGNPKWHGVTAQVASRIRGCLATLAELGEIGPKGHAELLVELRDALAQDFDGAPPTVRSQISSQLEKVLLELDDVRGSIPQGTKVDEIIGRGQSETDLRVSSSRRR